MSKTITYFSAAAISAAYLLAAGNAAAEIPADTIQHFHQGKFSSEKGEFKMSQNNIHDETLWEKTKEMSAKAWEATKEGTAKAWDKTKELGSDAWDATKEGAAKAGDTISETSEHAWEATKEGTAKAWDKTKEVSGDAWEATKEAADDAGDAISGKDYDNPMYNPENTNNSHHYNHHTDN